LNRNFLPITLTSRNNAITEARYYPVKGAKAGVIFVGGIGGDFDSPAKNLYPQLASDLPKETISALRVQFRYPTLLEESVQDVLVGAKFLHSEGVDSLGLVGHSFGGAVVIQAGIILDYVKTVVTLATQSFGAEDVAALSTHASILLIHGQVDETLSPRNSELIYNLARGEKKLEILDRNRHGLDESAGQVYSLVHDWLKAKLL
jgi:dienelactone hydrolase